MKLVQKLGLAALLLVLLFPPIDAISRDGRRSSFGHRFVLLVPVGDYHVDFRIDMWKLSALVLGVLGAMALGTVAFRPRS